MVQKYRLVHAHVSDTLCVSYVEYLPNKPLVPLKDALKRRLRKRDGHQIMSSSQGDLVQLSPSNQMDEEQQSSQNVALTFTPSNGCIQGSCDGPVCTCGNDYDEYENAENAPLISYQSAGDNESYFTDIHCHEFKPIHSNRRTRKKLTTASVVCLFFVVAEVVGGYLAHSLAIMTDAAHMLSDFAAFMISLFAIWVAEWQPDKKRTFGYYRAEILGALVSVLIIWVLTGILVYLAVQRVITKDFDINADIMLITAGVALGINILLGIILHQSGVGHGHSHGGGGHDHGGSHSHSASHGKPRSGSVLEKENINVRAAFIHVLGDVVQSVGVLIAAYIIKYKPSWKLADPICTFLFSILVLITTLNIVRDTIHVLMEGTPKNVNYNAVKAGLENIQGVVAAHSLHIWSLTVNKAALAVHLAVGPNVDSQKVLNIAHQKLKTQFQIFHSTIQVELYQESVMQSCTECQDLKD
ncbi:zinc transporter 2 [Nematostella vectensis]|uniref:zinc transporter 2 n=1 Tax=Nematostella vectensis TaxID=45351 RepID=UPI0020771877|nr:zinc transporter 2 [Nematostella vectensis]